jgi:glucose uptake protein GlcU
MRNYQYVFLGMSAQAFCTAIWLVKGTTPVSVGQQLFLAALFGIVAIIIRKWKRN